MKREHNRDQKMDEETICKVEHQALARRRTRSTKSGDSNWKKEGGGKQKMESEFRKMEMKTAEKKLVYLNDNFKL
jgi:hypothetical protein